MLTMGDVSCLGLNERVYRICWVGGFQFRVQESTRIHPNLTLNRIRRDLESILMGSKCPYRLHNTPTKTPTGCSEPTRIHPNPTPHRIRKPHPKNDGIHESLPLPYPPRSPPSPPPSSRAWHTLLATSHDAMSLKKRGFNMRWMTWRAISSICYCLPGCHVTQETRVQCALDDVASNIVQGLPPSLSSPSSSVAAAAALAAAALETILTLG
jgi:hypothetical protein